MLGIVLINYKSVDEVVQFVRNELSKIKVNYKLVIVDNSTDDEIFNKLIKFLSAEKVCDHFNRKADIYAIQSDSNLGYARANNLGARFLIDEFNPSHLLFSNSDIELTSNNVIEVLLRKLKANPKIGCISPKIVGIDGIDQAPARYLKFYTSCMYKYLIASIRDSFSKHRLTDVIPNAKEGSYYRLSGSFMLCDSNIFREINYFDEGTFLYAEELILGEKLLRKGYHNYFFPEVKILHNESQIVNKFAQKEKTLKRSFESKIYYYRKYKNVSNLEVLLGKFSFFIYLYIYRTIFNFLKRTNELIYWKGESK